MEYHWYEDYWTMPRNLPKGHQFFIGYYQTQRAIRFHVENIHTDQSVFLSTSCWILTAIMMTMIGWNWQKKQKRRTTRFC